MMDLFSRFPESNTQGQIFSKINEEKLETDEFDNNDTIEDNTSKSNLRFENLQKVKSLRKRNLILMIILLALILFFSYIIQNFLIALSLKLTDNYSIKEKLTINLFFFINEICINFSYVFAIILYLYYPLNFSFTYAFSLIISEYISALIYITYGVDREKDRNIKRFYENGSEKPDIQIIKIVVIFFGFWRLLKSKGRDKKEIIRYKKINSIIFLMSITTTLIIFLKQVFVEKCSLKSCFLGLFIGLLIYTFIYERMCIQFMKTNFFMLYINGNYWFFVFSSIIPLLIIIYMFNNYNEITDVFEIYKNIPFYLTNNMNHINQENMNRICLMKSLIVFLLIFIINGIKDNYQFVTSRNNKSLYKIDDVVTFNKNTKIQVIIKNITIYIVFGFILIGLIIYMDFYFEIPFIYFLIAEISIYFIFGKGIFGYGIKSMLKPNLDEERELEEYHDMELSGGSTPQNDVDNMDEGRI